MQFSLGYGFQSGTLRTVPTAYPTGTKGFSTASLLPQTQTKGMITRRSMTISSHSYQANAAHYRQQAIERALFSSIRINKDENGNSYVDSGELDREQALARKRETGGDPSIQWGSFKLNLGWRTMTDPNSAADVEANIDYFASEYAQYKNHIQENFTGEHKDEQLAKLDEVFSKYINEAANNFAKHTGSFLENNGVVNETDKIQDSFLRLYESKVQAYEQFIDKHPDYANIQGTEDAWLKNEGGFMGEQLRYQFHLSKADSTTMQASEASYSMDELKTIGIITSEVAAYSYRSSIGRSEEELGLDLGLLHLKYALFEETHSLSTDFKEKMQKSLDTFAQTEIKKEQEYLERQLNDPFVRLKEAYKGGYNGKEVLNLAKQITDALKNENVNSALIKAIQQTMQSHAKNQNNSLLARYHNDFSSDLQASIKERIEDWNAFVQRWSTDFNDKTDLAIQSSPFQYIDRRL